jgi:MFS family permease
MSLEKTRQLWRRGCFFAWPVEKTNNPKFIVPLLLLHSLVSGLFFGYQQGTVSVALTPFRKEFPKYFATGNANDLGSSLLSGLLGSSITIGMIGGSILGGFVSAILGFKMTALITCLINFVGAILSATMPLFELIIIARVIAGFGVGIGLVSIPRYVAIMSPKYKQIINVVLGFGAALSLLIAFCFGLGF